HRAGVGRGDRGHLVHRRGRAVVVDADRVQERHGGAPGPHGGELPAQRLDRRVHTRVDVLEDLLHELLLYADAVTTEPTGSPQTIRLMLPDRVRSKTTIGSLLSMQSEIAVVSMTSRRRLRTSM